MFKVSIHRVIPYKRNNNIFNVLNGELFIHKGNKLAVYQYLSKHNDKNKYLCEEHIKRYFFEKDFIDE